VGFTGWFIRNYIKIQETPGEIRSFLALTKDNLRLRETQRCGDYGGDRCQGAAVWLDRHESGVVLEGSGHNTSTFVKLRARDETQFRE
jgi:hypothetical protein